MMMHFDTFSSTETNTSRRLINYQNVSFSVHFLDLLVSSSCVEIEIRSHEGMQLASHAWGTGGIPSYFRTNFGSCFHAPYFVSPFMIKLV
jgi:hypothetical protein